MIERLVEDIADYFEYLKKEYGDYAAFHNFRIPLQDYLSRLGPYNISNCPFCSYIKSNDNVWNRCIQHQSVMVQACKQGVFCGICHGGIGEYVFPIQDFDGELLGYISLGGYRLSEEQARSKMNHLAEKYGLSYGELYQVYRTTAKREPEDIKSLQARVKPLCNMFILLYHERSGMLQKCREQEYEKDLLSKAMVFIRKNYANKITASDIASHCCCSVSTISHLFKRQTGLSVPEYVRNLRIEGARQFLKETKLDISQISYLLGFSSANYFSEIFKNQTGYSPKEYRRVYEKNIGSKQYIRQDSFILHNGDSPSYGGFAGIHYESV